MPDSCCKTVVARCGQRVHPSNIYKVEVSAELQLGPAEGRLAIGGPQKAGSGQTSAGSGAHFIIGQKSAAWAFKGPLDAGDAHLLLGPGHHGLP